MLIGTPHRATPALLLAMALLAGCGDEGAGSAGETESAKVETGAGTADGDVIVDANVTTDTQVVPFPDSVATGH